MQTAQPQKKGRIQQIKEFLRPPNPMQRIEDSYGIMKEVGGFRPLFNVRDTEQRRTEIIDALLTLRDLEFRIKNAENPAIINLLQKQFTETEEKIKSSIDLVEIAVLSEKAAKLREDINKQKDSKKIETIRQTTTFQAYKLARLFELFFATGSPWVRGADNERLSEAVACYIQNYEEFGSIAEALPDLHAESMQLLHLSWQGIDVTNTPGYIIQVTPVMQRQQGYDPNELVENAKTEATDNR
jgi:hypothetical protein